MPGATKAELEDESARASPTTYAGEARLGQPSAVVLGAMVYISLTILHSANCSGCYPADYLFAIGGSSRKSIQVYPSVAPNEAKDGGLHFLEKRRVDEDLNEHQYDDSGLQREREESRRLTEA